MGYSLDEKKGHVAVCGIFKNRQALEMAVGRLKDDGFRNSDISVLLQSAKDTTDFAHEKNTKAPEGITTGATAGILAGGALGWLAGMGALTIPGIGPFLAAGPIMASVAGAGLVGTLGGIAGGLIGLGIPEYEAKRYESFVKNGGLLISVHVDDADWAKKAKAILEACEATDISSISEKSDSKTKRSKVSSHSTFRKTNETNRETEI